MAGLVHFNVQHNDIYGTIPYNIGSSPIANLVLSDNWLNGTIPGACACYDTIMFCV